MRNTIELSFSLKRVTEINELFKQFHRSDCTLDLELHTIVGLLRKNFNTLTIPLHAKFNYVYTTTAARGKKTCEALGINYKPSNG